MILFVLNGPLLLKKVLTETHFYLIFQKGEAFKALFRVNAHNRHEVCDLISFSSYMEM